MNRSSKRVNKDGIVEPHKYFNGESLKLPIGKCRSHDCMTIGEMSMTIVKETRQHFTDDLIAKEKMLMCCCCIVIFFGFY